MAFVRHHPGVDERSLVLLDREEDVFKKLEDARFVSAWRELSKSCTWSTAFQDVPFIKTWWQVYKDIYAPLLLYQTDKGQALAGLLALARHRGEGSLVVAGAEQAEYKCWLAGEGDDGQFILRAGEVLSDRFPQASLRFNFLPPGTPIAAVMANETWAKQAFVRHVSRPLRDIGASAEAGKSLEKKSNKSRINRLRKQGELRLEVLTSAKELAARLPQVAEQYDLRQGGVNAVMPFRSDERKAAFLAALMEIPDLFSACLLMLDDQVIAANLGVRTGRTVSVGVFSFSPLFAAHSPGKLLLLLLSAHLADRGIDTLDLTPGGAWKERFASRHDEVVDLWLHFDRRRALLQRAHDSALTHGKRLLSLVGVTPATLRAAIQSARTSTSRWLHATPPESSGPYSCYRLELPSAAENGSKPTCLRDPLSRLLDAVDFATSPDFLKQSLRRLEGREHFYVPIEGPPRSIFWVKPANGKTPFQKKGLPDPKTLAQATLVYRDEAIKSKDESIASLTGFLCQVAQDRLGERDGKEIFVLVRMDDKALVRALQHLGCRPYQ